MKYLAKQIGTINGLGPLGNPTSPGTAGTTFSTTVSTIVGVVTVFGGLWFMSQIFQGAFAWLTAGSDKQALEGAKKRLINAVIGLVVLIAAYLLIGLVGFIFGLDILNPLGPFGL